MALPLAAHVLYWFANTLVTPDNPRGGSRELPDGASKHSGTLSLRLGSGADYGGAIVILNSCNVDRVIQEKETAALSQLSS